MLHFAIDALNFDFSDGRKMSCNRIKRKTGEFVALCVGVTTYIYIMPLDPINGIWQPWETKSPGSPFSLYIVHPGQFSRDKIMITAFLSEGRYNKTIQWNIQEEIFEYNGIDTESYFVLNAGSTSVPLRYFPGCVDEM